MQNLFSPQGYLAFYVVFCLDDPDFVAEMIPIASLKIREVSIVVFYDRPYDYDCGLLVAVPLPARVDSSRYHDGNSSADAFYQNS